MTAGQLISALSERGVAIRVVDDRLRYRALAGALTPDLRAAIATNRNEVIQQLLGLAAAAVRERCCGSCDRQGWIDEPPEEGRIRTVCGRCGKFIGYRPKPGRLHHKSLSEKDFAQVAVVGGGD